MKFTLCLIEQIELCSNLFLLSLFSICLMSNEFTKIKTNVTRTIALQNASYARMGYFSKGETNVNICKNYNVFVCANLSGISSRYMRYNV